MKLAYTGTVGPESEPPMHQLLIYLTILVLALLPVPAESQAAPPPSGALSVFLDCRVGCDGDFIRTEIVYVNWVRERTVADVHLLITSQTAGAGGEAFTFAFLGQRALAGRGGSTVPPTNAASAHCRHPARSPIV